MTDSPAADFRRRPRRRGPALEQPIYEAVLTELAQFGFAGMSVERVAGRAGTGKSAIYRRWATKRDLVADTLAHTIPAPAPPAPGGDLRTDLLGFFRQLAAALNGPAGTALRAGVEDVPREPQLCSALRAQVIEPYARVLRDLVADSITRGQARLGAAAPECLAAGPALLRQHLRDHGQPIPDELIVRIVDNALLPMLRPEPPTEPPPEL